MSEADSTVDSTVDGTDNSTTDGAKNAASESQNRSDGDKTVTCPLCLCTVPRRMGDRDPRDFHRSHCAFVTNWWIAGDECMQCALCADDIISKTRYRIIPDPKGALVTKRGGKVQAGRDAVICERCARLRVPTRDPVLKRS